MLDGHEMVTATGTRPDGSDLEMFIQWKGTDLCADFHCDCGYDGHLDSEFAYYVKCGGCGTVYELGTQVIARRVAEDAEQRPVVFVDLFPDAEG